MTSRSSLPRRFFRLVAALVALSAMGGVAVAQSPACSAWRSELASLQGQGGGGDPRAAQTAQRVGAQLAQATNQYRAMGCERGGFTFFGEGPPRECGGLRAQIGQLQGQYARLQQMAQGGAVEQRRAQLVAAINANCRAPQQRGFFETIFGLEPRRGEIDSTLPELDPEQPLEPEKPRLGGPQTVCVRTCDGFFFPLANNPGGRDSSDEMCQALCPGTQTLAYGMTNGGEIQNAVARSTGQPYASLPNAGKYQRSFDAACTCRAPGQSWAQALKDAEYLLDKRKGDVIVTEQRAAELSRPKATEPARPKDTKPDPRRRGAAPQPAAVEIPDEKPMPSENSPTAGTESAGVGPATVGERVLDKGDGLKRETQSVTGERRTVRIVAPNLAPNLENATIRP